MFDREFFPEHPTDIHPLPGDLVVVSRAHSVEGEENTFLAIFLGPQKGSHTTLRVLHLNAQEYGVPIELAERSIDVRWRGSCGDANLGFLERAGYAWTNGVYERHCDYIPHRKAFCVGFASRQATP